MNAMDFLTLLGDLDEGVLAQTPNVPVKKRKKRRTLWVAAAACFCACLLGFSAWFFLPPMGSTTNELILTTLRVENRLACYRVVDIEQMSRFEQIFLPDTPGEILCTHGSTTFYRIEGADDLIYLLGEADGRYTLYEFEHFTSLVGVDMRESYWYETGWLTDEDLAAFDCETEPTMGEIMTLIYGVTSEEGMESIRFERSHNYRGGVDEKVKVKKVTVKDGETLERLYSLISSMTPVAVGQTMDFGTVHAHDDAYLSGEAPLSSQTVRRMVLTLDNGYQPIINYYPATGLLYQPGSNQYVVLSASDNAWLIDLAEIDMEWKDWGTEKAPAHQKGEEAEVATLPIAPDMEASATAE